MRNKPYCVLHLNGHQIYFDLEDVDLIYDTKSMSVVKDYNTYYLQYSIFQPDGKKKTTIRFHQMVWKKHGFIKGDSIDHINGNGLDNRKANLRTATRTQNMANIRKQKNASSKYKGVTWNKQSAKWQSQCQGKYIGMFPTEVEAAQAYDKMAKEKFGDYANLNFPEET